MLKKTRFNVFYYLQWCKKTSNCMSHNFVTHFEFYMHEVALQLNELVENKSKEAGAVLVELYNEKSSMVQSIDALKLQVFHLGLELEDAKSKYLRAKNKKPKQVQSCLLVVDNIRSALAQKQETVDQSQVRLSELCKKEVAILAELNQNEWRLAELHLMNEAVIVD